MPSPDPIEAAAEALARDEHYDFATISVWCRDKYRRRARAALTASGLLAAEQERDRLADAVIEWRLAGVTPQPDPPTVESLTRYGRAFDALCAVADDILAAPAPQGEKP